jgi:hypothetical protein
MTSPHGSPGRTDQEFDEAAVLAASKLVDQKNQDLLREVAAELKGELTDTDGPMPPMTPCPCCGIPYPHDSGDYSICHLCWWEDEGVEEPWDALSKSGPNHMMVGNYRLLLLLRLWKKGVRGQIPEIIEFAVARLGSKEVEDLKVALEKLVATQGPSPNHRKALEPLEKCREGK